jgi:GntR family transcriptional repressor for pyruvate dehydrogenase complex
MKNKLNLKPLNKKKLYEEIALQIENLIENGELKVGNRLPAERELADIFNVSRNPVREAIRVLEEKQLLQSRPGDGTYVILKEKNSLIAGLASTIQSEKIKLHEIFEFRRTIEPQICSLAAENATQEDIDTLREILKSQKNQIENGKSGIEDDKKFHISLARVGKNSILLKSIYILNDILDESRSEYLQSAERRRVSLESHEAILLAVERKKPKLAWELMFNHLNEIEKVSAKKKKI